MKRIARIGRQASLLSAALAVFVAAPALFAAPPLYDEIFTYGDARLAHASLPNGPASPAQHATFGIVNILALPSGQMLATTRSSPNPGSRTVLNELLPDGSLRPIGQVPMPPQGFWDYEEPVGLALDHRGRLYLLTRLWRLEGNQPAIPRRIELDPATAAARSWISLEVGNIATAPDGLWALVGGFLAKLDPESGDLGKPVADLTAFEIVSELEADSSGRLYFIYQGPGSPPDVRLGTVDPELGLAEQAPRVLHEQTLLMHTLTIRRRCVETPTARCLQGGRFRAEATFTDYAGVVGAARVAPARSGDSGLFYFFDPANWELMVKVLDGCAQGSHYWVFSSASTDVAYTLTVTDTETGAIRTYQNLLGQAAPAVGDIAAFPCTATPRSQP